MLASFISQLHTAILAIGVVIFLYLVPGLVLEHLLASHISLHWTERLALALGIGIALPPLWLELAHLVNVPWQRSTVILYLIGAGLCLFLLCIRNRQYATSLAELLTLEGLLLALLTITVLFLRLAQVQGLPVGMWGDSYHHTMIAQLLVNHGGLFSSWEPYVPLKTFTYHFGFHANVAFFHWTTAISVPQALILDGQILSAATVVVAFLFTSCLTGNRRAGLFAALFTGLLNTQPAFYLNWGRYTQLTGQVILPAVLVCWIKALEQERIDWRMILLTGILSACLALTHYIVTIFAVLFLIAWFLAIGIRRPTRATIGSLIARGTSIGLIALLLIVPWFLNTLTGYLGRNMAGFMNGAVSADRIASYSTLPSPVPFYLEAPILVFALLGLIFALVRRRWQVAVLGLWILFLFIAIVPQVIGLPGTGIVDQFAVYIALYLPVMPLAAYVFGELGDLVGRWDTRFVTWGTTLVIVSLTIWGVSLNLGHIESGYQLFTVADDQAMEWIRQNTPQDARFFVNSFPAYGGSLIAGSDGGWWIPLLTNRQTNLPPITYGSELAEEANYSQRINAFSAELRGKPLNDLSPIRLDLTQPAALAQLRAAGFGFVYSGASQSPGPSSADWIDPMVLKTRPDLFRLVYERDGVMIFALEQAR